MAPQHDYILDNQNGAQFRADLNLALEAIATVNSGSAAPTTTYAYQYWADTTSGYLKQRDASNADWIVRGKLAADYGQAGQVLTSAGADEPAIWTSITEDGAWTVAEDATNSHYTFTGNGFDGTETNPTIYVTRGSVYNFTNADTANGFQIQSVAGLGGTAYSDGIVNNPALAPNTSTVETLVWTVQMDAPSELYYHSTTNSGPGGKIYVLNNIPSSIAATPEIVLEDSLGATAGIEQTAFIRDNDEFKIQTRSATDVLVSTDYNVTLGTSGATSHQWSINDAEAVRIDSSGRVLVGTPTSVSTLVNAGLQVQSTNANAYTSIGRWVNSSANPGLIFNKSRGGSVGTLSIVQSGDNLGEVTFTGDDGSSFVYGARIQAQVDGTPGLNDMPGRLVFSTTADGASSPTERMRIDSNGNVGIGTSSPSEKLNIQGGNLLVNGGFIRASGSGANADSTRGFRQTIDGTEYLAIYHNNAAAVFDVNSSERMRIDSSGNIGIGTSTPSNLLTVSGTGATAKFIGSGTDVSLNFQNSTNSGGYLQYTNTNLALWTDNAERMRIDSSGNVGIGTSAPIAKLHVIGNQQFEGDMTIAPQSTGGEGGQITLWNSDKTTVGATIDVSSTDAFRIFQLNNNSTMELGQLAGTGGSIKFTTEGSEKVRIDSSGNVGIGTTSPTAKLEVVGNTKIDGNAEVGAATGPASVEVGLGATADRAAYVDLVGDTTYTDYGLRIIRSGGANATSSISARGTGGLVLQTEQAGDLVFNTGADERMRIDSSARLLVGTSASTALLGYNSGAQFATNTGTVSFIRNTADSGAPELVSAKSRGSAASPAIVSSGDGLWLGRFAGYDGSTYVEAARITAAVDGTPGLNDMPGALLFSTTADGASSPTERMRIQSSGNIGIGTSSPGEKLEVNGTIKATDINFTGLATYADDTAAGTGGLVAGDVYKTSTGELRIKL